MGTLRLRNTLSRAVEPVEPMDGRRPFGCYSCGPTVYRFAHVGNLRTFLLADFIRRVLLYHGVEVFHVQNITDVDVEERHAVIALRVGDAGIDAAEHDRRLVPPDVHVIRLRWSRACGSATKNGAQRLAVRAEVHRLVRHRRHP